MVLEIGSNLRAVCTLVAVVYITVHIICLALGTVVTKMVDKAIETKNKKGEL